MGMSFIWNDVIRDQKWSNTDYHQIKAPSWMWNYKMTTEYATLWNSRNSYDRYKQILISKLKHKLKWKSKCAISIIQLQSIQHNWENISSLQMQEENKGNI